MSVKLARSGRHGAPVKGSPSWRVTLLATWRPLCCFLILLAIVSLVLLASLELGVFRLGRPGAGTGASGALADGGASLRGGAVKRRALPVQHHGSTLGKPKLESNEKNHGRSKDEHQSGKHKGKHDGGKQKGEHDGGKHKVSEKGKAEQDGSKHKAPGKGAKDEHDSSKRKNGHGGGKPKPVGNVRQS